MICSILHIFPTSLWESWMYMYMGCLAHSLHYLSSFTDVIVKTIFPSIFSLNWEGGTLGILAILIFYCYLKRKKGPCLAAMEPQFTTSTPLPPPAPPAMPTLMAWPEPGGHPERGGEPDRRNQNDDRASTQQAQQSATNARTEGKPPRGCNRAPAENHWIPTCLSDTDVLLYPINP